MKKHILDILIVICILVILGCGGYLGYYFYNSKKSEDAVSRLRDMVITEEPISRTNVAEDMVLIDGVMVQNKFEKIYRQNHDFIGWITIDDTNVDYPVMYTPYDNEDGEYYIHRDFDKEYSAAGLPFMDKNCTLNPPTDNWIIYGHNMNSGKMFRDIIKYESQEFYEDHKTFTFDTIYEDGVYEVIGAFYSQIYPEGSNEFKYYEFVGAAGEDDFMEYVNNIKRLSIIDTGVDVQYGDQLVTLSTCSYHVEDGRFAVIARKKK